MDRICHITKKVISADSSCSVVWWGSRAVCAEVSTGSVEASEARLGVGLPYGLLRFQFNPKYMEDSYKKTAPCVNYKIQVSTFQDIRSCSQKKATEKRAHTPNMLNRV
jgi:hypothetical protein